VEIKEKREKLVKLFVSSSEGGITKASLQRWYQNLVETQNQIQKGPSSRGKKPGRTKWVEEFTQIEKSKPPLKHTMNKNRANFSFLERLILIMLTYFSKDIALLEVLYRISNSGLHSFLFVSLSSYKFGHLFCSIKPLEGIQLHVVFFFFSYSYVHTRLGSFLPPAPTLSLTTHSCCLF
jgi:hypothetical protein